MLTLLLMILNKIKVHSQHVNIELRYSNRQADNAKETNNVKRSLRIWVCINTVARRQMELTE
jgi:hypothetical protein